MTDSNTAGAWARARELAERTPPHRNRYVDFLRAISIFVVVVGHWLMAAPTLQGGAFSLGDMLRVAPWSQWLTWAFQVMPLFFIVGGYSNAASWESTRRADGGYGAWSGSRLQRLVAPIVPVVVLWAALAVLAHQLGVSPGMVRVGSQASFIPMWFLAVYVMVVLAAPGTQWLWRRFGMGSFWGLAAGAALVDALAFAGGFAALRWANYGFVWLGVHQLGYAWRAGAIRGRARALAWAGGGLALLMGLVFLGSYPVSMITVPGEELSNSRPPTLALLALGAFQVGLVLAVEGPARRLLQHKNIWAATVLVNGRIMTVYLWHATAMVLLVGVAYALGGVGLGFEPASGAWWATRPLWIGILLVVLAPFLAVFGSFERGGRQAAAAEFPVWRSVSAALAVCAGLAILALGGIGSEAPPGLRVEGLLLTLGGAALIAEGPFRRRGDR